MAAGVAPPAASGRLRRGRAAPGGGRASAAAGGYLGHATLSVLIALLYAVFFRTVGAAENLMGWGALGALVHFSVGGLVVAAVFPVIDPPSAAAGIRRVGFAYTRYGRRDVMTFLAGHLSLGLLLGVLYPALHPALTVQDAL